MGKFIVGDIVVIPFPYTDLSQFKKRPALIIKELGNGDYLLAMITSQPYTGKHCISIQPSDFTYHNLPVASFVRCNRLFEANESIILHKVATVSNTFLNNVIAALINFLNN